MGAIKRPKPVGSILAETLKGMEIDVPLKAYSIWGAWKGIVGEPVALQTQPHAIRNRILFIDVSHSTWIQQLQFLKSTLLEKINGFLGEPLIRDIRFKLGKIPSASPRPKVRGWGEERLDKRTAEQIERLLEKIEDEGIKKSLQEVLIKSAKLEKARMRQKERS